MTNQNCSRTNNPFTRAWYGFCSDNTVQSIVCVYVNDVLTCLSNHTTLVSCRLWSRPCPSHHWIRLGIQIVRRLTSSLSTSTSPRLPGRPVPVQISEGSYTRTNARPTTMRFRTHYETTGSLYSIHISSSLLMKRCQS